MARKTVHRRVTQARNIAAGAVGLAAYVAERFAARQRAFPGLEGAPDFLAIQVEAARWLGVAADRLEAADRVYERQKTETRRARRERDAAAKVLYRRLVAVRKALSGAYPGTVVVLLLGLDGKTPREPWPLLHAGREAVWRLRDGSIELPRPKTAGFSLDRHELAAGLEVLVDELERAVDAVFDAQAGETVRLVARDEVLAEFREIRTGAARLLEGIYLAAGLQHLVPGIRHPGASVTRGFRPTAELETTAAHRSRTTSETLGARSEGSGREAERETTPPHRSGQRSGTLGSRPGGSGRTADHETTAPHRSGERSDWLGRRAGGFLARSGLLGIRAGGLVKRSGSLETRAGGLVGGSGRLGGRAGGLVARSGRLGGRAVPERPPVPLRNTRAVSHSPPAR